MTDTSLNALLAEKLLGWSREACELPCRWPHDYTDDDQPHEHWIHPQSAEDAWRDRKTPDLSGSPEGMDMVALALRARGLSVTINYIPEDESYHGGEVECVIADRKRELRSEPFSDQVAIVFRLEASMAVALAAAEALEAKP